MIRKPLLLCTVGLVLAVAACDKSTGLSSAEISQDDANELAAAMDDVVSLGSNDFGLGPLFSMSVGENASATASAVPVTIDKQFSVTRPCPQGGQVTIAGTAKGSADRATHSLTLETKATRTDANCAFQTRRGVVTINGNPNIVFESHINIVGGKPTGLQTSTQKGSFTWARGDLSGTCAVDLSSTFNPETHTATVKGTFCNRTVDITHTRTPR